MDLTPKTCKNRQKKNVRIWS